MSKPARRRVVAYLKSGRAITRDDADGSAVGVTWSRAVRDGGRFDTPACEKLLAKGCKIEGQAHRLALVYGARVTYVLEALAP